VGGTFRRTQPHEYDEYLVVVQGSYGVLIGIKSYPLNPGGMEMVIIKRRRNIRRRMVMSTLYNVTSGGYTPSHAIVFPEESGRRGAVKKYCSALEHTRVKN